VKPRIAHVLAVWFGCGHVPVAPGLAGTLGAIPLYLLVRPFGPLAVAGAAIVLTAIGVWAAGVVERKLAIKDPQIRLHRRGGRRFRDLEPSRLRPGLGCSPASSCSGSSTSSSPGRRGSPSGACRAGSA